MAALSSKSNSSAWLVQLRRDLQTVLAGFRGERAPSWSARDGSRYTTGAAPKGRTVAIRELEVVEVVRETSTAVSLSFADPQGRALPPIRPGQFFTLVVEHAGQTLRRAYSVSSNCRERGRFTVTIKRAPNGRVSNYLNDEACVGMRVGVLGPSGEFGAGLGIEPGPELRLRDPLESARATPRRLLLIAGGSGITPMMAIITTLLASEGRCEIALIYANRSADQVIFAERLEALLAEHGTRLRVAQLLEHPSPDWAGAVGVGDRPTLARMLDAEPLAAQSDTQFMICGPTPMMDGARELLAERGVAADRVHVESFLAPQLDADAEQRLGQVQAVSFVSRVAGAERTLQVMVEPGQSLLDAGLAAGLDMPYSCAMGGCAACKVELISGAVAMREPNCLGPKERAAGHVLACVASPTEPCQVRIL